MMIASILLASMQIAAKADVNVPRAAPEYCTLERVAARRAWSMYIAKNPVSADEMVANGARMMGLGLMMTVCEAEPEVSLDPLSEAEIEQLRQFEPDGQFVGWARCLNANAPEKTLAYLEGSDRSAFQTYVQTKQIGGHDEEAFLALISTDECADEFVENVKARRFYEDLNWFARMAPNTDAIADWHERNTDA